MSCIKTGAHAFLHCYSEWLYGDMFKIGPTYIMRVVQRAPEPLRPVKHFIIYNYNYWREKNETHFSHPSTLVTHQVEDLGYEGIEI